MTSRIPAICLFFSAMVIVICFLVARDAQAQTSRYGCYEVTGGALNIRKRAWSKSPVLAVARRGEKLAKRRRFCAVRGFWCPVRTKAGVSGWADKQYLRNVSC